MRRCPGVQNSLYKCIVWFVLGTHLSEDKPYTVGTLDVSQQPHLLLIVTDLKG